MGVRELKLLRQHSVDFLAKLITLNQKAECHDLVTADCSFLVARDPIFPLEKIPVGHFF